MSIALPLASAPADATSASRAVEPAPLLIALAVFALAAFSPAVLNDGDTWSHIATGQWILQHGDIPRADPFSFTFAGAPWTAHEWLSEVLFALAYRVAGWNGVTLLTGAAAGLATFVMANRAARDLSGIPLLVVAALSASLIAPSLLARPHILALPALALWCEGLMRASEGARPPSLRLLALMALWANLHGGFAFGLALIAPFGLEAWLAAPQERRPAVLGIWGLFALTSVGAATLTPFAVAGLVFPFKLLGVAHLANIGEWRPEDFARPGPMEIALLGLIALALTRPLAVPLVRAAVVVGLIHLSMQHARHELLLAIVAPMLLAGPIARAIGAPAPSAPSLTRPALIAAAAVVLLLTGARLALPIARADAPTAPISALRAAPPALRDRPVLNGYAFGGYLIAAKVKPFIDGRADMYGDAFLDLYGRIAGGDQEALEATLKRYAVAWTIFAPGEPVVALMDREPGWRRLYADKFAVVHVREGADGPGEGLRGD
ncbi:MAG: hypothetical protein ABSC22_07130 [Roseiarcus sp.]|jgi:hypothetical protein